MILLFPTQHKTLLLSNIITSGLIVDGHMHTSQGHLLMGAEKDLETKSVVENF